MGAVGEFGQKSLGIGFLAASGFMFAWRRANEKLRAAQGIVVEVAMFHKLRWLVLALVLGATPSWAVAEQVRFRFVPVDPCGTTAQVPVGPEGALGELKRGFGLRPQPFPNMVRPNQMVTFRHPYNGRNVTVPLRLPPGPPRLEHGSDRITYNYGDYIVEARFIPDGSVEVYYNSGMLRPLRFD